MLYLTDICNNADMWGYANISLCVMASVFEWQHHNCVFLRIPFHITRHESYNIIVNHILHIKWRMLFQI